MSRARFPATSGGRRPFLLASLAYLAGCAWAPEETRNAIGMRLVRVPAGEFLMGSTPEEIERMTARLKQLKVDPWYLASPPGEGPRRPVTITRPFWIGVHEVTLGQFRAFVADTGYQTEAERDGRGAAGRAGGKWETRPEYSWRHVGYERPDDEPVVNVTWDDAAAFCEWLSKKEGKRYRLPTETEWEYAARAGTETPFYWGEDEGRMDRYVWHAGNSRGGPHAVGRREPNAFGLHDACGNVYEYCLDRYAPRPYAAGPAVDPFVPPAGDLRVVRGGSWGTLGIHCRSAFRGSVTLGHRNQRDGFRVVREE